MKSKAPLALIELAVVLAVFGLAAVLCLRAFLWADAESDGIAARDRAMTEIQSAAEVLKACRGDFEQAAEIYGGSWDGTDWTVCYDEDWSQTGQAEPYRLTATRAEENLAYLGAAEVCVFRGESCLVRLEVAWQEVEIHG